MRLLLDNNANIEILDIYERDLIGRNIDKPEVIKVLISYGINLDYNYKGDAKAHINAAVWADMLPIVELLVEAGADVNQENTKFLGYTAVHEAILINRSPEFLRRLLECNGNINQKDKYGNTAFHR